MVREYRFALPPFCGFTPEEWAEKGHDYDEIRDNMLGWDITDYGMGDFDKMGFSLITLRNGNLKLDQYTKTYAEKLLYIKEQGGAVLPHALPLVQDGGHHQPGRRERAHPGISLYPRRGFGPGAGGPCPCGRPGDGGPCWDPGAADPPYLYHDFTVEPGSGPVLLGEVSQCNDDNTDNRFYEQLGRFPTIEEDEPPYRLLCSEYPAARE